MTASTVDFDVAVIGAGVAGSCAALALARDGARVAIFEAGSFPRHKVCGEFFSPDGVAVLQRLGLVDDMRALGAHDITHARALVEGADTGAMPLPRPALALSRYKLDEFLWQRASEVCEAHDYARVRNIKRANGSFQFETPQGELRARFVVEAAGHGALHHRESSAGKESPQRFAGIKAHWRGVDAPDNETQLFPFRGGYCGLVQVEDGIYNTAALARYDVFHGPEALWREALKANAALAYAMRNATRVSPWVATANLSFGKMEPVRDGIVRCGDAAGHIQPFTGDGQAMAARAGELAAVSIGAALRGGISDDTARAMYAAAWRREFAHRLDWGTRLQPLLLWPHMGSAAALAFRVAPSLARAAVDATRT